jgi:hypothetical protein
MTRDDILRKAHALLNLADDSATSEHEAEAALLHSQRLMEKYDLTLSDIEEYKNQCRIVEETLFVKTRMHVWDKFILSIIQTFFHVELLRGKQGECVLVGEFLHVRVAKQMYQYLKSVFISNYKTYKTYHKRAQAQAFYYGLYTGLYQKLQEHAHTCTALQLYKRDIDTYIHTTYGRIPDTRAKTIRLYDTQAYVYGEQLGGDIEIATTLPTHALAEETDS